MAKQLLEHKKPLIFDELVGILPWFVKNPQSQMGGMKGLCLYSYPIDLGGS